MVGVRGDALPGARDAMGEVIRANHPHFFAVTGPPRPLGGLNQPGGVNKGRGE